MQLPSRARAGHCRVLSVLSSRLAVGKNQLSSDCFFFRSHPQDSLLPPSHFLPLSVSIIKSVHSLMKEDDTMISVGDVFTIVCRPQIYKDKHYRCWDIHRYSIQALSYPHRETEAFCSPWDSDVQRPRQSL